MEHLESVRHGPTFLQGLVAKRRDIRVTVIGEQIFPAAIDSQAVEVARIDFRKADIMDLPHVPITLPEPVAHACVQLVKQLGLNFGAIDLIETPDGEYVFLENNPNGQWYWVEMITGQPMACAMADLLERGVVERGGKPLSNPVAKPAREPYTVPVGEHTIPLQRHATSSLGGDSAGATAQLVASRAWFERKQ